MLDYTAVEAFQVYVLENILLQPPKKMAPFAFLQAFFITRTTFCNGRKGYIQRTSRVTLAVSLVAPPLKKNNPFSRSCSFKQSRNSQMGAGNDDPGIADAVQTLSRKPPGHWRSMTPTRLFLGNPLQITYYVCTRRTMMEQLLRNKSNN